MQNAFRGFSYFCREAKDPRENAMAQTISVSLVTGLVASTSWVTQKNKITWPQSPRFFRVRKYFVTFRRRRREFRVFVVLLPCPRSILAKKSLFRTFTSCYYKPRLREARFWGRKWPRERRKKRTSTDLPLSCRRAVWKVFDRRSV